MASSRRATICPLPHPSRQRSRRRWPTWPPHHRRPKSNRVGSMPDGARDPQLSPHSSSITPTSLELPGSTHLQNVYELTIKLAIQQQQNAQSFSMISQ